MQQATVHLQMEMLAASLSAQTWTAQSMLQPATPTTAAACFLSLDQAALLMLQQVLLQVLLPLLVNKQMQPMQRREEPSWCS